MKLRVKPSVLVSKMMPSFLIAVATASSSTAMTVAMDINEKDLGIDPSFSRTATPIGGLLYTGCFSVIYMITGAYLAEHYGVQTNFAWWVTLWFVGVLLTMATPPVPGGTITCLSILMAQLQIPQEGLAAGVTLIMFLDFICTGARLPTTHMEVLLQAGDLELLDLETLRRP